VVLQEIFGVNQDMRQTCDWLAGAGFLAVCPDLFWRMEPGVSMSDGSEAEWKKAIALYTAFDRDQGIDDACCTMTAVKEMCGSSTGVGVMGYCLGGLLTFRTAARRGAGAAVAYYGGSTEDYLHEAPQLHSPLLMHLAGADEYMPAPAQDAIRAALAGKPQVEIFGYPGRRHAFARNGGAHYDEAAATLANERTLRFLYQHLC
jgi:carboxymethylenebutenolidase